MFQFGEVAGEAVEPVPEEGWQRIHSPGTRPGYLLAGVIGLLVPPCICIWLGVAPALIRRTAVGGGAAPGMWGAMIVALVLFIPLHELLHAVWHPGLGLTERTVLAIWPARLRFGVYYEGCMSRRRWLMMRLSPLAVLCGVPMLLLTFVHFQGAAYAVEVFLEVMFVVNGIGSGGDVVAAIWVLRQVPAGAQICFLGGRAYWRPAGS